MYRCSSLRRMEFFRWDCFCTFLDCLRLTCILPVRIYFYWNSIHNNLRLLIERSLEAGISEDLTKWLVSILSIGNLTGRFVAGFVSFFPRIDPTKLVASMTIAGAVFSIISSIWFMKIGSIQILYAVTWGFFVGKLSPCSLKVTSRNQFFTPIAQLSIPHCVQSFSSNTLGWIVWPMHLAYRCSSWALQHWPDRRPLAF